MRIVVLHDKLAENARQDEVDGLIQAEGVSNALSELGHEPAVLPFSFEIRAVMEALYAIQPEVVFNLVESVGGNGRYIHVAPALLDYLRVPYTGCPAGALFLTSNKLLAKTLLRASGIATPPWVSLDDGRDDDGIAGRAFIVKSVWEHASIGLTEASVVQVEDLDHLRREMRCRCQQPSGDCFAELFVEGREFNLSILASGRGPEVLPPAEIVFDGYPPGRCRIVDYDAKWNPESFAYEHTPRTFAFRGEDRPLLDRLIATARKCWDLFGLRGYARVDFRVDSEGNPWVLEVNANPCVSPDGGFVAAAERGGSSFRETIERIVADSLSPGPPRKASEWSPEENGKDKARQV